MAEVAEIHERGRQPADPAVDGREGKAEPLGVSAEQEHDGLGGVAADDLHVCGGIVIEARLGAGGGHRIEDRAEVLDVARPGKRLPQMAGGVLGRFELAPGEHRVERRRESLPALAVEGEGPALAERRQDLPGQRREVSWIGALAHGRPAAPRPVARPRSIERGRGWWARLPSNRRR
jgi:hypothetical protein